MDIIRRWDRAMRSNGWLPTGDPGPLIDFPFDRETFAHIIRTRTSAPARVARMMSANRRYVKGPWTTFTLNVRDGNSRWAIGGYTWKSLQTIMLPVAVPMPGYAWCTVSDLIGLETEPQLVGLSPWIQRMLLSCPSDPKPNLIVANGRAYLWVSLQQHWNVYDQYLTPELEGQLMPLADALCRHFAAGGR